MVRERVSRKTDVIKVVYDESHWRILKEKRRKALKVMEVLEREGLSSLTHGSIARGDVNRKSDIDIVVPVHPPYYKLEFILEKNGYVIYQKIIVQATPSHTPKVYFILDPEEELVVSFPIARLLPRELEFYYFGGAVGLKELKDNKRVPGVNKKLELIIPTQEGHIIEPVIGREGIVAEKLGISIETVQERVRVLTRRETIGRTGVYIKRPLGPNETLEEALEEITKKNPYIKKILWERG